MTLQRPARLLCIAVGVLLPAYAQAAGTYFAANLSGAQEVPANASTATGFGRVNLNEAETSITVSVYYSGFGTTIVAGHIHGPAAPGVNAPVLIDLGPTTGVTSGSVVNFTAAVTPSQVAQLKAGQWYINFHTMAFGGGEIRGQLLLDPVMVAALSSTQEVPTNVSTATGSAFVSLSASGTQALVTLNFASLSANAVASHLHAARSGINGPVICPFTTPSTTSGSVVDALCTLTAPQALQLRQGGIYANVHSTLFPGGEIRGQVNRVTHVVHPNSDVDGDSKADFLVARPNSGPDQIQWWSALSSGGTSVTVWGDLLDFNTGRLLAQDYDGDGSSDVAFWRAGSPGSFWIRRSFDGMSMVVPWGASGDDVRIAGDFDGDGRADVAIYRSGTPSTWWIIQSSNGAVRVEAWGMTGDLPGTGDFDGDGKTDLAIQRGSNWWIRLSSGGLRIVPWGTGADSTAFGDYDGDGKTDLTVVRNEVTNLVWYTLNSATGTVSVVTWGPTGSNRVMADYDGDGRTDVAVVIPGSPSSFWVRPSNGNPIFLMPWGVATDYAVTQFTVK